jgi:hypothetical protein
VKIPEDLSRVYIGRDDIYVRLVYLDTSSLGDLDPILPRRSEAGLCAASRAGPRDNKMVCLAS